MNSLKHHSKEADELDELCMKLHDFRVKQQQQQPYRHHHQERRREDAEEEDLRLCDVPLEQLNSLVQSVQQHRENSKQALIRFRRLLAHDDIHPYLDKIIATGVVKDFVMFLDPTTTPDLQFEAAWILTNISAGNTSQTKAVVEANALDPLLKLITASTYKEIREQCIWCLGNIAGDSPEMRRLVVDRNALQLLVNCIEKEMQEFLASNTYIAEFPMQFSGSPRKFHRDYNLSTLRISIWALSNFCRGTSNSDLDWNLVCYKDLFTQLFFTYDSRMCYICRSTLPCQYYLKLLHAAIRDPSILMMKF
jgi:hypothetical protein